MRNRPREMAMRKQGKALLLKFFKKCLKKKRKAL